MIDEGRRRAVAASLQAVRARIDAACAACGREPGEVRLVAVSKFHDDASVRAAFDAGQRAFGENYVQELCAKSAALADCSGIEWHVIGHLQRNKARDVVARAAMVHTVDSARLAAALDRQCAEQGRALPVLVQVNVAGEAQKSGCAPDELSAVLDACAALANVRVRGLMTVPPETDEAAESLRYFEMLASLRDAHGGRSALPELSMGMTHDLEYAVRAGATLVRVGTAIFGARAHPSPAGER